MSSLFLPINRSANLTKVNSNKFCDFHYNKIPNKNSQIDLKINTFNQSLLISLILIFCKNQLQVNKLHESHHILLPNICENSVLIYKFNFDHTSFLDEEKLLSFCPSISQTVCIDLALFKLHLILIVLICRNPAHKLRCLAIIQEEIVVLVFLEDPFNEQLFYFL